MTSEAPRLGRAHPPADRPEPAAYPTEPSEPVQRPSCHPGRSAQRGVEGSRAASASALFDLHCHLDFDPDTRAAAQVLAELCIGAFSTTVTPEGYERARGLLEPFGNVRVGLGLHPWWIADGRLGPQDVALFERLAKDERFIGEVGLDFGRDRAATRDMQVAAFERVARACASGGKVLSIHAVKAAGEALDVLERAGALVGNACIFHWFSGASDELQRAVRAGCFFSINPRMLASKRGRAYAQAVPAERLLLETDAPSQAGERYDAPAEAARLAAMLEALADLRRTPRDDLAARIARTSRQLFASA